ncbi:MULTISPECIES: hypothetical protein [unclassified Lysinibacillus]|nr:hypothetical protein [Lysinibacillus sp. BPa_S21]MCL1696444.1 hypothetical protein [Lysinibacillus sp. BPa_S21]
MNWPVAPSVLELLLTFPEENCPTCARCFIFR